MDQQKRKWCNSSYSQHKKSKSVSLEVGMIGFLCTCNFKEKECIRDAYKLLEEFNENLEEKDCKVDVNESESKRENDEKKGSEEEDISDALNREINELNEQAKKPPRLRKFQNIDIGVKNTIFIRTTLPNPLELALKIIKNVNETKKQKSRFLLRFIPILKVCRANVSDIKAAATEVLEKYFSQEPKSFSIVFNRHCNNSVDRMEIIENLAAVIAEKNPGNKADLKNPDIAVVVEVIKGHCLLSVAPDYFKYKKYNLLELCNVKDAPKIQVVAAAIDDEKNTAEKSDKL